MSAYRGRSARRGPSAADRAAARRELDAMRSGAAFRFGRNGDADAYARECARIDALAADARARGLL